MKKFFSLVLALVLALSLTTIAWGASATVNSSAELQSALDTAVNGDVITLGANITGDVTVTQKANVKITIDGNGKTFAGTITVDGKSATIMTAGITIKNVNFDATSISKDACINLGNGTNATRYVCNLTVEDCTFTGTGDAKAAVKSYTGGDHNLTITGCTVNAGMHSLAQLKNVETGLKITGCQVNSKNGINLNNTLSLEMSGCEFNVKGYTVRFGESGTVNTTEKTFNIANSTLKSACTESDDAVIVFRDSSKYATLTLTDTTRDGIREFMGNSEKTTIISSTSTTTKFESMVIDPSATSTVIDVSDSETTTTVGMSADVAADVFSAAKPVEIVTADASVTFDADAVETIGNNANTSGVALEVEVEVAPTVADVETANTTAYNEVMATADENNAVLVSIELTDDNGDPIFSESNATKGTVTVKVKLPAGLTAASMYYLNGNDVEYMGEYTADADGYITVVLNHFSEYVIVGRTATSDATKFDMVTTDAAATKTVGVTVTVYKAKAPKDTNKDGLLDQVGNVQYMVFSSLPGKYFVQVNSVSKADYTVYHTGTKTLFGYFDEVASPFYKGNGVAFYDFGEKCGQYDDEPTVGAKYFLFQGDVYQADATYTSTTNLMVGNALTPVTKLADKFVDHVPAFTYDKDYKVVGVKCAECGTPAAMYANWASVPKAAQGVAVALGDGQYYVWAAAGASAPSTDKTVQSAQTFDAGIAMYVGMSVMAAAGSAVVIGKKKD